MFRIPLPLNDSTLLVVPRWGELGTVMQVMLLTLMAVWSMPWNKRPLGACQATGRLSGGK